jgi:hypothetical protein
MTFGESAIFTSNRSNDSPNYWKYGVEVVLLNFYRRYIKPAHLHHKKSAQFQQISNVSIGIVSGIDADRKTSIFMMLFFIYPLHLSEHSRMHRREG